LARSDSEVTPSDYRLAAITVIVATHFATSINPTFEDSTMKRHWSTQDTPSQKDRRVIITGATGGLGWETALAASGADVVLTGRNDDKGQDALQRIRAQLPQARIRYEHLDLASLASVSAFGKRHAAREAALDLLINNAGVMTPPVRLETEDRFELQFGTNYLRHFALTAHLLPLLLRGVRPHVTNVSSLAHRNGRIHFDDPQWLRSYKPFASYAQSKLAMLMFTFELQRRSSALGWGITSNAAHPGYATTGLQSAGPRLGRNGPSLVERVGKRLERFLAHSAHDGALPTLFAATSAEAQPGGYYGPQGFYEMKGPVAEAFVAPQARDSEVAAKLWTMSVAMTGAEWPRGAGVGVESRSGSSPFAATPPAAMRSFSPASR
jgi:NAD(P)-dependent dehydrogenase (short-subunit alcohol dehydrogenase family)